MLLKYCQVTLAIRSALPEQNINLIFAVLFYSPQNCDWVLSTDYCVIVAWQCNPSVHIRAGTDHGAANSNDEKTTSEEEKEAREDHCGELCLRTFFIYSMHQYICGIIFLADSQCYGAFNWRYLIASLLCRSEACPLVDGSVSCIVFHHFCYHSDAVLCSHQPEPLPYYRHKLNSWSMRSLSVVQASSSVHKSSHICKSVRHSRSNL